MHFLDATSLDSQKPDVMEYYNQSQELTPDQMIGTCNVNVVRNTKRWHMVIFSTILNIAAINAQTSPMLNSNVKIRSRIFVRNLVMLLVSEQKGVQNSLQVCISLYTWNFINFKQLKGNSNKDMDMAPLTSRKEKYVRCCKSRVSPLSRECRKCCAEYAWSTAQLFAVT